MSSSGYPPDNLLHSPPFLSSHLISGTYLVFFSLRQAFPRSLIHRSRLRVVSKIFLAVLVPNRTFALVRDATEIATGRRCTAQ